MDPKIKSQAPASPLGADLPPVTKRPLSLTPTKGNPPASQASSGGVNLVDRKDLPSEVTGECVEDRNHCCPTQDLHALEPFSGVKWRLGGWELGHQHRRSTQVVGGPLLGFMSIAAQRNISPVWPVSCQLHAKSGSFWGLTLVQCPYCPGSLLEGKLLSDRLSGGASRIGCYNLTGRSPRVSRSFNRPSTTDVFEGNQAIAEIGCLNTTVW